MGNINNNNNNNNGNDTIDVVGFPKDLGWEPLGLSVNSNP